jgi:hypothetical protein
MGTILVLKLVIDQQQFFHSFSVSPRFSNAVKQVPSPLGEERVRVRGKHRQD